MRAPLQPARISSLGLIVVSLFMVACIVANPAFAEPRKTSSSMSSRVTSQRELCEDAGGGQMDYVNSYEDGKLVGVTTYCKGGTSDGWNCANTQTTYECWQGPKSRDVQPPLVFDDLPDLTIVDVSADVESQAESIQATPEDSLPGSVPDDIVIGDNNTAVEDDGLGPTLDPVPGSSNTGTTSGAVDPTAGQPSSGMVVEWTPVNNPNTVSNQSQIVVLQVTPVPTPTP